MSDSNVKGMIFNVQKFSVHDGAGIRTIVFLTSVAIVGNNFLLLFL